MSVPADDAEVAIRRLTPSGLVRRFASRIVETAGGFPILDLAGGGGRNAFFLASLGANVICLDRNLAQFEYSQRRLSLALSSPKVSAMRMDIFRDGWPFGR